MLCIAKCVIIFYKTRENKADVGFGFDGDGDRVGVIAFFNKGNEFIFIDKIGLLQLQEIFLFFKKNLS